MTFQYDTYANGGYFNLNCGGQNKAHWEVEGHQIGGKSGTYGGGSTFKMDVKAGDTISWSHSGVGGSTTATGASVNTIYIPLK